MAPPQKKNTHCNFNRFILQAAEDHTLAYFFQGHTDSQLLRMPRQKIEKRYIQPGPRRDSARQRTSGDQLPMVKTQHLGQTTRGILQSRKLSFQPKLRFWPYSVRSAQKQNRNFSPMEPYTDMCFFRHKQIY